jgi:hypothetical protein
VLGQINGLQFGTWALGTWEMHRHSVLGRSGFEGLRD